MNGDFGVRVNKPNMIYTHKTADYRINLRTNSKGLRSDSEISYENSNSAYRVVVLGDSFGMGYGVNIEDSFTEVFKTKLQSYLNIEVEIINLSVSGFGTAEQLLMFINEGKKYKPNLVISTWHYTDVKENVRAKLYKLENDNLLRDAESYLPGVKQREFLFRFPAFQFIAENSHLYNLLRSKAASWVKTILYVVGKKPANTDNPLLENAEAELTAKIMSELHQEILNSNSQHLILSIPRKQRRGTYVETVPPTFQKDYLTLSLVGALKENEEQLLYWERSHGHFTPFGCQVVGTALFNFVKENIVENRSIDVK